MKETKQREIKFRAWDKIQEKMYAVAGISPHNEIMVSEKINSGRQWYLVEDIHIKKYQQYGHGDVVLQQFTGLKDKNGEEIYEGDVVRENNELGVSDLHYEIGYKDGHTSMTGINKGNTYDRHGIWNLISSLEIIGNIYSNPELLAP